VLLQLHYIIIICNLAGALHKVRGTQGGAGPQPFCCYIRSITAHTVKAPGKAIFAMRQHLAQTWLRGQLPGSLYTHPATGRGAEAPL
jgi:hypothetical protein